MTVYLLWLHDSVLGVFASFPAAEAAGLDTMKQRFPGQTFKLHHHGRGHVRWFNDRVARLEVEPFQVCS